MSESNRPPKVTVLLATYNGASHCQAQIVSVLWQTGVETKIVVRDDGSCDDTISIIAELDEKFPNRIYVLANFGHFTGRAAGNFFAILKEFKLGDTEFVAFADQDDVWAPNKLIRGIRAMQNTGSAGYSSNLVAFSEREQSAWFLQKTGREAKLDYLFQGASAGCTYIISRNLAEITRTIIANLPALCDDASHDWIIYAIARSRGFKWFSDPGAEIFYRQHSGNQYGTKRGWADVVTKAKMVRSRWLRTHVLWLENVVQGTDEEREVFSAVRSRKIKDKIWLIRRANSFRRHANDVSRLRIAMIAGFV